MRQSTIEAFDRLRARWAIADAGHEAEAAAETGDREGTKAARARMEQAKAELKEFFGDGDE